MQDVTRVVTNKAEDICRMLHELLQTKHRINAGCYTSCYRQSKGYMQDVTRVVTDKAQNKCSILYELLHTKHRIQAGCYTSCYRQSTEYK